MNPELPKITIVTPNLNQANYLEQTILSVIEQGYPNLEYIIIDGGSTDRSVEIIKKYEYILSYWISEPDSGMYQAVQKGFEKSTGEIMAWINSDDMYHPNSLFTIAEIFTTLKNVNWLIGTSTIYDKKGRTLKVALSYPFTKYEFLSKEFFWIQQESCFWRRSLWNRAGAMLNTSLKMAGDFELWLRFFRYDKPYIVDALVGGIRVRGEGQLTQNLMNIYFKEALTLLSKEPISDKEKRILRKYFFLKKLVKKISYYKILNAEHYINDFKIRNFLPTKKIKYDFEQLIFYFE